MFGSGYAVGSQAVLISASHFWREAIIDFSLVAPAFVLFPLHDKSEALPPPTSITLLAIGPKSPFLPDFFPPVLLYLVILFCCTKKLVILVLTRLSSFTAKSKQVEFTALEHPTDLPVCSPALLPFPVFFPFLAFFLAFPFFFPFLAFFFPFPLLFLLLAFFFPFPLLFLLLAFFLPFPFLFLFPALLSCSFLICFPGSASLSILETSRLFSVSFTSSSSSVWPLSAVAETTTANRLKRANISILFMIDGCLLV